MRCARCGSYAINHSCHGRNGADPDLCDVCYWRKQAEGGRAWAEHFTASECYRIAQASEYGFDAAKAIREQFQLDIK